MKDYIDTAEILHFTKYYNFRNLFKNHNKLEKSHNSQPTTSLHLRSNSQDNHPYMPQPLSINAIPLQYRLIDHTKYNNPKIRSSLLASSHKHGLQKTKSNLLLIEKSTILQLIKSIQPQLAKQKAKRIYKLYNEKPLTLHHLKKENALQIKANHENLFIGRKDTIKIFHSIDKDSQYKKWTNNANQEKIKRNLKTSDCICTIDQTEGFGIKSLLPLIKEATMGSKYMKAKKDIVINERNDPKSIAYDGIFEIRNANDINVKTMKNSVDGTKELHSSFSLSKPKSIDPRNGIRKGNIISVVICPKRKDKGDS
jgi:hypothetical protein